MPDLYRFKSPQRVPAPREGHLQIGPSAPGGPKWGCTSRYMTRDGKPFMPVMAEFHFSRYPAEEWEEQLLKIKAGDVDIIATYLFWIHHEEEEGVFDFSGQRDLRRFLELCHRHGLLAWVRLGPWCHGEARNGGFPDWLRGPFGIEENGHIGWQNDAEGLRSNAPEYLRYVNRLYAAYGEQCRGLMAKDGGPIIGVQVENEYSQRGEGKGAAHIARLIEVAREHGFDVPFFSVTGWHNAPFPAYECLPMFGGYPDQPWADLTVKLEPQQVFRFDLQRDAGGIGTDIYQPDTDSEQDLSPYPLMTCEIGVGVQVTDHRRPWISAMDGMIPMFTRLGVGAACLGYYVYHGGTNPEGKFTTLQESRATGYPNDCPVKSYDFQAPIRESGRIDERYHYLRAIHAFIHDFGELLAPMVAVLPDRSPASDRDFGPVRMALRTDGTSGFLFVGNHVRNYPQPDRPGVQVTVSLPGREILVPRKPVEVPSSSYFVWPVAMPLEDAVLLYATAQPLCVLEHGTEKTHVFAQTITNRPEYVFDPETIQGEEHRFEVLPGLDSVLEVKSREGRTVRILTLTPEQALRAYKHRRAGEDHLFISEADATFDGDQLTLFTSRRTPVKLQVMPSMGLTGPGLQPEGTVGEFAMYSVASATHEAEPPVVTSLGEHTWHIETGSLPRGARLRIKYTGDVAELYLGHRLVYDNFYNGDVFEVSLDRFADKLREEPLTLKISPMPQGQRRYLDVPVPQGDPVVESVEVTVENRITLQPSV